MGESSRLTVVWLAAGILLSGVATAAPRQLEGLVGGGSIAYGNDDNITEHSTNEVDADFAELSGVLGYGVGDKVNFLELLVEVESRDYEDNDRYDTEQAEFTGILQWQPNRSNRIELHGAHTRVEENEDQTNRENQEIAGDEYFFSDAGLTYHMGHAGNLIAAEVGLNHHWRRYLTNRGPRTGCANDATITAESSCNALKDRDVASANVSVYYQFTNRFRAVLTAQYDDYDYNEDVSGLNAENVSVVAGLEWEDDRSRAWVRAGSEEKEFDVAADTIEDGDMGIWQVGYAGRISDNTEFELSSVARLLEGSVVEEYVEQIATDLSFNAALTDNLKLSLGYGYIEEQFVDGCRGAATPTLAAGASNVACYEGREDTVKEVSFRLNYNFIENLAVGVDYVFTERESNLDAYNYERNVVRLFVESAL